MSIISTFPEKKGLNTDDINDIAAGEISNGFVQSQTCYSTEEQVVGKWIDGKPLYQRTVYIRQTAADADNTVANLDVIDCVTSITGVCKTAQGDYESSTPVFYTLSATDTAIPGCVSIQFKTKVNKIRIIKRGSISFGVAKDFYITFQYTKTTD